MAQALLKLPLDEDTMGLEFTLAKIAFSHGAAEVLQRGIAVVQKSSSKMNNPSAHFIAYRYHSAVLGFISSSRTLKNYGVSPSLRSRCSSAVAAKQRAQRIRYLFGLQGRAGAQRLG